MPSWLPSQLPILTTSEPASDPYFGEAAEKKIETLSGLEKCRGGQVPRSEPLCVQKMGADFAILYLREVE